MPDELFTEGDTSEQSEPDGSDAAEPDDSHLPLLHRREFLRAFTPGVIGLLALDGDIKLEV